MREELPPGPSWPAAVQSAAWWSRSIPFLERARARYGNTFTVRLVGTPPFVIVADPDDIKSVFTAPPDVLHPGEGARILEPVVGTRSVILLDEREHLEQRKLMLPAFHGAQIARMADVMSDVAEREIASWPREQATPLHPRLQHVAMSLILRTVFGLEEGERMEALRATLGGILEFGMNPLSLMWTVVPDWLPVPQLRRFEANRAEADEMLFALIAERRAGGEERDDVLSLLLAARHEDGTPMSADEIRDELLTLLVAGHETTASQLAWTIERLRREPAVLRRLTADLDAGESAYLSATITESLRRRPVIPNAAPRQVVKPFTLRDRTYQPGAALVANAYLVHHDPAIYPEPYAFRPERWLDATPGTYSWIPFGGGRRRCLGASFAQMEMKAVLGALLRRCELDPGNGERTRRRAITLSPAEGATAILRDRAVAAEPVERAPAAA